MLPVKAGELNGTAALGFVFAFQILPTIIFVASIFAILYHLGVMQVIVRAVAKLMTRLMGASGAESLNVAASIFMGQTEAPLTIRPVPQQDDAVGADVRDDRGHGARERQHHGRLHRVRGRGQAPAGRRDHDRARDDPARQDAGARDRDARDRRHRQARHAEGGRQRDRRRRARHQRRPAPRAQRRGHADLVPLAGRAREPAAR